MFRINYQETGATQTVTATAVSVFTWSGAAATGQDWSAAANWASGTAPAPSGNVDVLQFPTLNGCSTADDVCYTSKNDVTGVTVGQMSLPLGDGYSLSGDGITLGAGGLSTTQASGSTATTIGMPIALGASQSWSLTGEGYQGYAPTLGNELVDTGGLAGSGSALTVNLASAADLNLTNDDELGDAAVVGQTTTATGTGSVTTNGLLTLGSGAKLNASDGNSVTVTDAGLESDGGSVGALRTTGANVQVGHAGPSTATGLLSAVSATFDPTTNIEFEIPGAGTTAGTGYGQLSATGAVDLAGATLTIDDNNGSGSQFSPGCGTPAGGTVYTLVSTAGALTGTFGNAANGSTVTDTCASSGFGSAPTVYRINYTAHTVTATVIAPAPVRSGPSEPTISGPPGTPPEQGQTLIESHASWSPTPTSYRYQWMDCSSTGSDCVAISGAMSQTYELGLADVGHTIVVQETAYNGTTAGQPASSAATAVVQAPAPPIKPTGPRDEVPPTVAGSPAVGKTLRAAQGEWSGTSPISYRYQWYRCTSGCASVSGATTRSYPLTNTDLGAKIAVEVTAPNAVGSATASSALVGPIAAGSSRSGGPGATPPCTTPGVTRNAANPLALASSPGSDPLRGAPLFIDGPSHGAAAGLIARLLGIDASTPIGNFLPAFPDSESWQQFLSTTVASKLPTEPASIQRKVEALEKIASEPESQRISVFAESGTPAGIAAFTYKLFCHNFTADPGSVPVISTYFMHPVLKGCSSTKQIDAYMPLFKRRINAMVNGTGDHPVVYLLELDAIGSSSCMVTHHSIGAWETMLRYEVDKVATLPHAVVYVEGGYSDANTPKYAAKILNKVDIRRIRGFFTNDTHLNWTINEIRYGDAVSRLTHGAHFIVNTAQNGNGPLLNPHPSTQGIEDLCNPPGRGLGPRPTTDTGYPKVDALLWTHVPGNSSGSCNGGTPSGTFWPARAISLAEHANNRLGPGFKSEPY